MSPEAFHLVEEQMIRSGVPREKAGILVHYICASELLSLAISLYKRNITTGTSLGEMLVKSVRGEDVGLITKQACAHWPSPNQVDTAFRESVINITKALLELSEQCALYSETTPQLLKMVEKRNVSLAMIEKAAS